LNQPASTISDCSPVVLGTKCIFFTGRTPAVENVTFYLEAVAEGGATQLANFGDPIKTLLLLEIKCGL